MGLRFVLVAACLVALSGCAPPLCSEVTQREFVVLRVIDGDTFQVHYDGEPTGVRLLAFPGDAWSPESPTFDTPEKGEPGYAEATDGLYRRLFDSPPAGYGGRVHLDFPAATRRDHFGRLLATARRP